MQANAGTYLTGLDDRKLETVRLAAVNAHAGDQSAALSEARAAHRKVTEAGLRMMETVAPRVRVWSEPDNSNLTALEEYSRGKS